MSGIGDIFESVLPYWRLAVGLAVLLLALFAIMHSWDRVRFIATRFWYATPLIGKTARLAKNTALGEQGWFRSEKVLCDAFRSHLEKIVADPAMYDRAQSYLTKVHEIGRSPLSLGGGSLIFILILIESLGFAYVLAGYTLPGASEALQVPGALLIAILIAILLVFLTHTSGYEWHRQGLVKMARLMWLHDDDEEKPRNLIIDKVANLANDEADNKDADGKDEKPYRQLIRRLNIKSAEPGIPWFNIVTVVFIVGVAIFAFNVRYQTYERDQTCEALGGSQAPQAGIFSGIPGLAQAQPALPSVITEPQRQAENQGRTQECSADRSANVTTFLILAFVFVAAQLIGWIMGFNKSFAGRESKKAWKKLAGFDDRAEYENWHDRERERILNISQRHLSNLQSRLSHEVQHHSVSGREREAIKDFSNKTFDEYLESLTRRGRRNRGPAPAQSPPVIRAAQ